MTIKSFIVRCSLFLSPIVFLYLITLSFYSTDAGDLLRIGYLVKDSNYRSIFQDDFNRKIYYQDLTTDVIDNKPGLSVLVIGDSFTGQGAYSYINYLAEHDSIDIVALIKVFGDSPIQTLSSIINGDVLDSLSFDYLIFESVERYFALGAKLMKQDNVLNLKDFQNKSSQKKNQLANFRNQMPGRELIYFPLYNLLYPVKDNAFFSRIHRASLDSPLFSGKRPAELLILDEELETTPYNNDINNINLLNEKLNSLNASLNKRGVKLIVLPAPNKFDVYYDYLVEKNKYPEPQFFDHLTNMKKEYIYLDTKAIFTKSPVQTDLYFYDDTHWSPHASKIIAKELTNILLTKREAD